MTESINPLIASKARWSEEERDLLKSFIAQGLTPKHFVGKIPGRTHSSVVGMYQYFKHNIKAKTELKKKNNHNPAMATMAFSLSHPLHKWLIEEATRLGVRKGQIIKIALAQYRDRVKKENPK